MGDKKPIKSNGWALFDRVVTTARLRTESPWKTRNGEVFYEPDFETLRALLRVPYFLGSSSTSGLPALALDVWTAYEFRRAGFSPDAVWPREDVPRILPGPIQGLLAHMGKADSARLREILSSGKTFGGAVGTSAKVLGKHYMKQVDVVMSDWDTGPELLVSTKRMDDSYGNNAPNRMEESYGDAKNLRSRHPRAAIGFLFSLRSDAFLEAPRVAAWIIDLLGKLGREDDAYDAVALIVPRFPSAAVPGATVAADSVAESELIGNELLDSLEKAPLPTDGDALNELYRSFQQSEGVELNFSAVPEELSPAAFFQHLICHVLDNSPITRHEEARSQLDQIARKAALDSLGDI